MQTNALSWPTPINATRTRILFLDTNKHKSAGSQSLLRGTFANINIYMCIYIYIYK